MPMDKVGSLFGLYPFNMILSMPHQVPLFLFEREFTGAILSFEKVFYVFGCSLRNCPSLCPITIFSISFCVSKILNDLAINNQKP